MSQYDHLFKFLIIGDSCVGKTSLIKSYVDQSFPVSLIATLGIDYKARTVVIDNKRLRLQIWDTVGQERFHSLGGSYFRGCSGVIVAYDVTSRSSFINVPKWMKQIDQYCPDTPRILVGNKSDLIELRQVYTDESEDYAELMGVEHYETSAKNSSDVDKMFMALARKAYIKVCDSSSELEDSDKEDTNLHPQADNRRRNKCC